MAGFKLFPQSKRTSDLRIRVSPAQTTELVSMNDLELQA